MLMLVLSLPLTSSLLLAVAGRWLHPTVVRVIACLAIALPLLGLAGIGLTEDVASEAYLSLGVWWDLGHGLAPAELRLHLDGLSLVVCLVVALVSSSVLGYSASYMAGSPVEGRFLVLMTAFTTGMLLLVLAADWPLLFVGWEAIGMASYGLVSLWGTRAQAITSALQALLVNRVGDVLLTLAMVMTWSSLGTTDWELNAALGLALCGGLWVLAVGAKSAQWLQHVWLPNAMEAPTPVSALLHAATLVVAGVYVMLRASWALESGSLALLAILGALTSLYAAGVGVLQVDVKRTIAYSTSSQMGLLMLGIGLGAPSIVLYHLASHAGFKAGLFMAAGLLIHGVRDEQSVRRLGSLARHLPEATSLLLVCGLSLAGLPYLAGFETKDLLLDSARSAFHLSLSPLLSALSLLAVGGTCLYSVALARSTGWGAPAASQTAFASLTPSPWWSTSLLLVASIAFGYLASGWIQAEAWDLEASLAMSWAPLMALVGAFGLHIAAEARSLHLVASSDLGLDAAYNALARLGTQSSGALAKLVDQGTLDLVGPIGLSAVALSWGPWPGSVLVAHRVASYLGLTVALLVWSAPLLSVLGVRPP